MLASHPAWVRTACRSSFCVRRSFSPALSLSLLSPKLSWSEDETKAGVQRGFTVTHPDGTGFTPYDLKRLQARPDAFVPTFHTWRRIPWLFISLPLLAFTWMTYQGSVLDTSR